MSTTAQATIEAILVRMRRESDFPAMARTVSLITEIRESEEGSSTELANIILKDFALTSKILKLVNSAGYLQYGEVTTVSRAIMLLGFENIRNIAVALLFFEHLQTGSDPAVKDLLLRAIHSGLTAQRIAAETEFVNAEEAFICSLFHTFGGIMVAFYLPDKMAEIAAVMERQRCQESAAALSVLGGSYESIGMALAENWNLPKRLTFSMKKLRLAEIGKAPAELERLSSIANFAYEITRIIAETADKQERNDRLGKLISDYRLHYGAIEGRLSEIIAASLGEMSSYANLFKIPMEGLPFAESMVQWEESEKPGAAKPVGTPGTAQGITAISDLLKTEEALTPESIFSRGVLEINTAIINNDPLNDIIRIALETMFRGLQGAAVNHVLFLLKDPRQPVMRVKFGFGGDVAGLKDWFAMPLGGNDLFDTVVATNRDTVIKDLSAADVKRSLPAWYSGKAMPDAYAILLPLIVAGKPLGLFFLQGSRSGAPALVGENLKYLTILRDQTVLAIRQRSAP